MRCAPLDPRAGLGWRHQNRVLSSRERGLAAMLALPRKSKEISRFGTEEDRNRFTLALKPNDILSKRVHYCQQDRNTTPNVLTTLRQLNVNVFTGRNEVVAKVIFLHLSVILFTGGVSASVHAGIPPPRCRHPPEAHPQGADTPPGADTPWD